MNDEQQNNISNDPPDNVPDTAKSSRLSRFRFYKVLLLCMAVLLVAVFVGAYYFWGYIKSYEDSRLEPIIQALQENIDYDFWERNVADAITARLSEFDNNTAAIQKHLPKVRDVRYTLRQKNDESTAGAPVYILRAGALDIGIIRFIPTESAGYGFYLWDVESIDFLDSFVDTLHRSVSITASQNAHVAINGVPVSQAYLTDCDFEYGATYLVNGIFGDVEVTVNEFDGRESIPYFAGSGEYLYPIIIPFARQYNIVVPEKFSVFTDGERVSADNITDDLITPGIFNGVLEASQVPVKSHRYEFELEGLYLEPVITVADENGMELLPHVSDEGTLLFIEDFSSGYKDRYTATAEDFIRAYVSFAANIGDNVDANFTNVSALILRNSELYRRVNGTRGTLEFVSGATVVYNSLEIDNFRPYGDEYFSCEIYYDISNRTRYTTREVEARFEVLFVLSGGRWLAVKMDAMELL